MVARGDIMTEKMFLFSLGESLFALELKRVEEVIRVPELFKVPLTPEYIAGVTSFRGNFIPVIDLHQKLFGKVSAITPGMLVVCNYGEYIGFLVTERKGIETLKKEHLKESSEEFIEGIYLEGDREVRLLNAENLVKVKRVEETSRLRSTASKKTPVSSTVKQQEKGYLVFKIAGKEYAFPLDAIAEVTRASEVREVPNPPPGVLGIINWRQLVIPVVDTSKALSMEQRSIKRMLIVQHKGQKVAFQVEDVAGIMKIPKESIQPAPAYIRRKNHTEVSGTYSSEGTLILILTPEALLNKEITEFAGDKKKVGEAAMKSPAGVIEEKYLFFNVGEWIFGLNVKHILELKNKEDITKIPRSPGFLAGIVEKRGNIIPIIDTNKLFSLGLNEELKKLVILEYEKNKTLGLLADKLLGIYSLSKEEIMPLSASFEEAEVARFIEATTKIENKAAFLLKPEKLLRADEARKVNSRIKKYKKEKNTYGKNQSSGS